MEISTFDNDALFAPPPQQRSNDELGQEDFLTLMISQFRNQDPFEPMDNGDFLGQLAQFGTVSGIENLNSAFAGLAGSIQSEQALQAANLVGHDVLAATDIGYLEDGGAISGAIELDSSVSNIQIEITDVNGELVQRLEIGERPPGLTRFEWDGLDLDGETAPEGHYQITTRVIRGGTFENVQPLLQANIDSVSLGRYGQGLILNIRGGDTLSLSQVNRIL